MNLRQHAPCDQPTLLVLDSEGVEQFVDGDLESDTAVLLEANFVPPTPGSVRDDGVATTVTRDDVQVVRFSVPLNKSVMKKLNVKTLIDLSKT